MSRTKKDEAPATTDNKPALTLPDTIEFLMCPLTDAELRTRGEELARAIKARDEADAERKAATDRVKDHQDTIDRLKTAILYRQEQRDVPCRQVPDVAHLAVDIYRNDTSEFVRRREIRDDERQPTLWPKEDGGLHILIPAGAKNVLEEDAPPADGKNE